jgi:hypothetical protein
MLGRPRADSVTDVRFRQATTIVIIADVWRIPHITFHFLRTRTKRQRQR